MGRGLKEWVTNNFGNAIDIITWQSAWSYTSKFFKTNITISFTFNYMAGVAMNSGTTIGKINNAAPSQILYYPCTVTDSNYNYKFNGVIRISTTGNITYYGPNNLSFQDIVLCTGSY